MAVDVDKILGLLDQTYINRAVLQQHDVARETFTLRLYKHLKLVKTYGIAVGQAGL